VFAGELSRAVCGDAAAGAFEVSADNRDIVNSMFAWVWRYDPWNVLRIDYGKGFFLTGAIGTGKSTLMRGLQQYMNSLDRRGLRRKRDDWRMGHMMSSASVIANEYAAKGLEALMPYSTDGHNLCIDELGREPMPAKHYGTEMNVCQFVLQMRYDYRHRRVTHLTSNLAIGRIMPLYGDYIADRFLEMFNIVEFEGSSIRHKR